MEVTPANRFSPMEFCQSEVFRQAGHQIQGGVAVAVPFYHQVAASHLTPVIGVVIDQQLLLQAFHIEELANR